MRYICTNAPRQTPGMRNTTTILSYKNWCTCCIFHIFRCNEFTNPSPSRSATSRQRFSPASHFREEYVLPNSSTSTIFGPFDRIPKLPVDVLFPTPRKLNDCQHRRSDKSPRENVDGLTRSPVHGVAEEMHGDRWSKSLFEMDFRVIATRNWPAMIDNSISRKREIDALF